MHLLNHLKEVIPDHGPVTSFWCFSFERFNGIPFYGAVQQHKIRRTPKHEKIHTDKIPKGYETNKRVRPSAPKQEKEKKDGCSSTSLSCK